VAFHILATDSQDVVGYRLQGGYSRAGRHQAPKLAAQLIAPHVLGLGPKVVVRSQRTVDEFLIEGPDCNGVEGRGGGRGLPYFGRTE
jgi:hypothetical protein